MKDRTMKKRSLRDGLMELETMSPHLRDKYKQEVKAMIERKLTPAQRAMWTFSVFLGFVFLVVFGWAVLISAGKIPLIGTVIFTLGAIGGLIEMVVSVVLLKRGSFHAVRDSNISTFVPFAVVLVAMIALLIWGQSTDDQLTAIQMVLFALVFLVLAVMFMIGNRVNQAEWKLREQLLRIELELAELAEKLGKEDEGSRRE